MLGIAVVLLSVVFGGTMATALIGWLLIRIARLPRGYAFAAAFVLCAAFLGWGIGSEGIAHSQSLISIFGCAVGALINYALARRRDRAADDLADFE